jgi:2-polyprenyl-6-methoxyphenol hydroxylase-like FAD-dependent oxidoreductase
MPDHDVLIVGAGPTGLVLALWLTKLGIRVRVVDKAAEPGTTSRAMIVHARILELYRQLDLADAVIADGHATQGINIWARGRHKARLALRDAGAAISPYPFFLVYPQDRHERLLVDRLASLGVRVERETELLDFEDYADGIVGRLRHANGVESTCAARFIAGCDGAKSMVRKCMGAGFEGGTYRHRFYVADVEGTGPGHADEAHVCLDRDDFFLRFSYGDGDRYRLIGTVREDRVPAAAGKAADADALTFDDVSHRAIEGLGLSVSRVNWFSTYRVHHRVTDHFRRGRAFLLGDAAHVHSPVGGQGMNTGIGDAINLAWKLAAVVRGTAPDALLDSYEAERIGFARRLVETTDRLFSFVTAEGNFADFVRTRIAPLVASVFYEVGHFREFLFRLVSQTTLNYRDGPLSEGAAGKVRGGDRLPWVASADNYGPLASIAWQVHVYGTASDALRAWCPSRGIALHVFAWTEAHETAGLARDAAYLLRPDTYVAVADGAADPRTFERYLSNLGFTSTARH